MERKGESGFLEMLAMVEPSVRIHQDRGLSGGMIKPGDERAAR